MDPSTINPSNGLAYVQRTMQLTNGPVPFVDPSTLDAPEPSSSGVPESSKPFTYSNIFVVGDSADAFGAIAAGHCAYYQVDPFLRNFLLR